jgi:hypothetical protein
MDGRWVRLPQEGAGVVIFVHGILSSGETCWKHPNGTYWPTLLSEEQTLSDLGIYVYTYQTSIGSGYYSVSDVVGDLKERLKGAQAGKGTIWQGGGPMLFVCHSMGGIVARKLIVRSQMELIDVGARIGLFLVASPSLGSSYANWVTTIARAAGNTQAISLRFAQDNQWLNELDAEFQTLKESARIPMVGRELQEDKPIVRRLFRFLPQIVAPYSAHRYFGDPLKVAHSDHFSISKPADRNAFAHQVLVRFLKEAGPRLAALTPPRLREDPGTIATSSGKAGESVAPPATVAEPADDWPEEGGAAFVCVTERGSEVKTVKSFQEYCAEYGAPLPAEQSYSGFAVRGFFENGGAFAVIARAAGQGARRAQASIRLNPEGQALVVSARDVGTYGNRLQVELSSATRKGIRVRIREASVSAGAPRESLLEDFDNVPVDGGPPVLVLIDYLNRRSQWINASVSADALTIRDGTLPPTGTWQLEGGADGIVTAESLLGTNEPHEDPRLRSGLTGLKMSWHCGLVCIPDLSQPWLRAEDRERVTAALLAHCADEQAVAVLAAGTSNDELMRVHAPCDSAVAIAAWPWLSVFSPDGKQEVVIPPDGHVAGAIARSDRRQGLHKPPTLCTLAGTLRTAPSIAATAEQRAEHGLEAERRGFNLLAMVDGKPQAFLRPLITTALAETARDPTRSRLVTWISRRIRDGLMWVTYERPDKEVEQKIVQQVDEFLHKLWKMGALGGMSPQEAYRVTVTGDTSSPVYRLEIELTFAANYERMSICYVLSPFD